MAKALKSVKAAALLMNAPGDLYNPTKEAAEAADQMLNAQYVLMPSLQGHFAAVTEGGKKLQ